MSFQEYCAIAREKYLATKQKNEPEIKPEIKPENEQEQETVIIISLLDIDDSIENIQRDPSYETIVLNLILIREIIEMNLDFISKINKMQAFQEKIIDLVQIINAISHSGLNKNPDYIKHVSDIAKSLFELTGIDVAIEIMDVSGDAEMARKMADTDAYLEAGLCPEIDAYPEADISADSD